MLPCLECALWKDFISQKSIIVNNSCLEEVNRLRTSFRKDLPLYEIPIERKKPVKSGLLDGCDKKLQARKSPRSK